MTSAAPVALVLGLGLSALGLSACSKDRGKGGKDGPTSTPTAQPPTPETGPCATDADCTIWMDNCDCHCHAIVGKPPTRSDSMCGPRNCGAGYPCADMKAVCDPTTKSCRSTKEAPAR